MKRYVDTMYMHYIYKVHKVPTCIMKSSLSQRIAFIVSLKCYIIEIYELDIRYQHLISVSEIKELLVGARTESFFGAHSRPWEQTVARVRSAFAVLTKVEDLTIVSCDMDPFFATLGATADNAILLPGLRRLTIYVGCGDLDVSALIQCAKGRREHSRSFGKVTIIFENEPGADMVREVESLGEFVEELDHRVGVTPKLDFEVGV